MLAVLEMSFAGGAILGAVLAGALALLSRGPFMLSAVLVTAVGMILVALSPSPIWAALVMVVSMGLVPVSQALTGTLISVVDSSLVLLAGAALSLVIGLIGAPVLLRVHLPRSASQSA